MAGGIKGITVKIGGDTTELGKSLSNATKQSLSLQKELKGVNSLLKMDPKNVTLLKQKSDLLKESISQTKQKLSDLVEVQKKVDSGEIKMTEAEYRNLQREIASTEGKLKSLIKDQNEFGSVGAQKVSAVGKQIQSVGDTVTSAGKKVMPVSTGITAIGFASVKTSADFDESMSKVSAISGATGKNLEKLKKKARQMGAETKFSASESADAMSYMAMAGWKTSDMLDGISGVMYLASASGEDLATTSDILTDGLTAFGLSAKDSGRMANVMASASANANTNVSLLGESYKYCASTAGAMGYSLEDVTESLGLMANAGVKGSQAGTSLKTAMINLAKPTAQMKQAMDKYGISITNSDGSMKSWNDVVKNLRSSLGGLSESEKTAAVATIFGKEAAAGMLSVINAGPKDVEKLNKAINNSEGSAKKMANTMNNNLKGKLTILKSQLEELAISFGNVLMPVLMMIVSGVQKFVDVLNGMPKGAQQVIVLIMTLIAILGPLLIAIGKVLTAAGTIMTWAPKIMSLVSKIGAGLKALWATMMGHPIVILIVAITALVAGLIYAYNHSKKFRDIVNGAFTAVKNVVSGVVSALVTFFTSTVPGALEALKNGIVSILSGIAGFIGSVIGGISSVVGGVMSVIMSVVTTVWGAIKSSTLNVWNSIKMAVTNPLGALRIVVTSVLNGIKSSITTIWNGIKAVTTTVWGAIKMAIINPIQSAWKTVSNVISTIKKTVKGIFDGIKPKLHISLPHISVNGGKPPFGIGGAGKLPSFSIKWNKLGAIFDKPTIFGTRLGFQGVGEAGPEAVAPIEVLQKYVREAVIDKNDAIERKLDIVISMMASYYPDAISAMNRPVTVGVSDIDSALGDRNEKIKRGW